MATITLKTYRCIGAEKRLIRTRRVEQASAKSLTGKRALALLRREVPEAGYETSLQKTEDGWLHMRAVTPLPGCNYHYEWEHIYVTDEP